MALNRDGCAGDPRTHPVGNQPEGATHTRRTRSRAKLLTWISPPEEESRTRVCCSDSCSGLNQTDGR